MFPTIERCLPGYWQDDLVALSGHSQDRSCKGHITSGSNRHIVSGDICFIAIHESNFLGSSFAKCRLPRVRDVAATLRVRAGGTKGI